MVHKLLLVCEDISQKEDKRSKPFMYFWHNHDIFLVFYIGSGPTQIGNFKMQSLTTMVWEAVHETEHWGQGLCAAHAESTAPALQALLKQCTEIQSQVFLTP